MSDLNLLRDLRIRVVGSFGEVGKAEFSLSGHLVDVAWFPKGEWAILANLAEEAGTAQYDSNGSFLSAAKLAKRLWKRDIIAREDPLLAIRAVFRLRKRLRKLKVAQLLIENRLVDESADFANLLIQRIPLLGYRLAVPADALNLEILEPTVQGM